MADEKQKIVPDQHDGGKKDIERRVTANDLDDARKLFVIARNRLSNVNDWGAYADGVSAKFQLTDPSGNEVARTVEKGDCFKIALPAPGPSEGKGFDWVQIEAIEDLSNSQGNYERFAMRVRPVPDPTSSSNNVAHFFNDEATSTFLIERKDREVVAAVYGRNEKPNTETDNIVDKVRNAVVGATAIAGLSNIQWGNLVSGLIEME